MYNITSYEELAINARGGLPTPGIFQQDMKELNQELLELAKQGEDTSKAKSTFYSALKNLQTTWQGVTQIIINKQTGNRVVLNDDDRDKVLLKLKSSSQNRQYHDDADQYFGPAVSDKVYKLFDTVQMDNLKNAANTIITQKKEEAENNGLTLSEEKVRQIQIQAVQDAINIALHELKEYPTESYDEVNCNAYEWTFAYSPTEIINNHTLLIPFTIKTRFGERYRCVGEMVDKVKPSFIDTWGPGSYHNMTKPKPPTVVEMIASKELTWKDNFTFKMKKVKRPIHVEPYRPLLTGPNNEILLLDDDANKAQSLLLSSSVLPNNNDDTPVVAKYFFAIDTGNKEDGDEAGTPLKQEQLKFAKEEPVTMPKTYEDILRFRQRENGRPSKKDVKEYDDISITFPNLPIDEPDLVFSCSIHRLINPIIDKVIKSSSTSVDTIKQTVQRVLNGSGVVTDINNDNNDTLVSAPEGASKDKKTVKKIKNQDNIDYVQIIDLIVTRLRNAGYDVDLTSDIPEDEKSDYQKLEENFFKRFKNFQDVAKKTLFKRWFQSDAKQCNSCSFRIGKTDFLNGGFAQLKLEWGAIAAFLNTNAGQQISQKLLTPDEILILTAVDCVFLNKTRLNVDLSLKSGTQKVNLVGTDTSIYFAGIVFKHDDAGK